MRPPVARSGAPPGAQTETAAPAKGGGDRLIDVLAGLLNTNHNPDQPASGPRRGIIGGVHCAVMPRWAQPLPQKDETVAVELGRVVSFAQKHPENGETILAALGEAVRKVEQIIGKRPLDKVAR